MVSKEIFGYRWMSVISMCMWIGLFFYIMHVKFNFFRLCKDERTRHIFRDLSLGFCVLFGGGMALVFPICLYLLGYKVL